MRLVAIVCAGLLLAATPRHVNPRLKDVHKIHVADLGTTAKQHGKVVTMTEGSNDTMQRRLVGALSSSGRFSAVTDVTRADAVLEGTAGWIDTHEKGKHYTSGFARLQLVSPKSKEVLWVFEYRPTAGACCNAADRVTAQIVWKLVEDAGS